MPRALIVMPYPISSKGYQTEKEPLKTAVILASFVDSVLSLDLLCKLFSGSMKAKHAKVVVTQFEIV